ncbi:MAG: GGDEF domain-containing protein [Pseudoxanthomonas sp.]
MLARAETLGTAKREEFHTLLARLDPVRDRLTAAQRQRLDILHALDASIAGRRTDAEALLGRVLGEATDPDARFRAGTMLASLYASNRRFEDSLKTLAGVLPLEDRIASPTLRQLGWRSAAGVYNRLGLYELGRDYAGRILRDQPSPLLRCAADNLRLEAALGLGERLTEGDIRKVIHLCEPLDPAQTGYAYVSLARWLHDSGDASGAIAVLRGRLPTVAAPRYPQLQGGYQALLGKYLLEAGDYAGAGRYAAAVAGAEAHLAGSEALASAYYILYRVAERRGNVREAFEQYRRYADTERTHLTDMRDGQLAYQIVNQQSRQKSQQIAMLDQRNRLLQLQQALERESAQNSRLVAALAVLVACVVAYWALRMRRVQKALRLSAETDSLTRLNNRDSFIRLAGERLALAARDGHEVVLMMFDLDHFKSINDRFGHGTGDWVLRAAADAVHPFCRGTDCLARMGGEEFAMLMPGMDERAGQRVAEEMRARLAAMSTTDSGYSFVATGSFGVTSTTVSGYDLASLLSNADRAMYRAKREGRNRVCVFVPEMSPEREAGNVVRLPGEHGAPQLNRRVTDLQRPPHPD